MSTKIHLDQVDAYSADAERVANSVKRVIEYSDNEEKLFGCFNSYRRFAASTDKTIWDKCFGHFLNRESGRLQVGQDLVMMLREKFNKDIDELCSLASIQNIMAREGIPKKKAQLVVQKQMIALKQSTKVEEFLAYAQLLKSGYDEAEILSHTLSALWKHQEKYDAVLNDTTGNAQLTHQDMRDRQIDMRRYLDSRTRWRRITAEQAALKTTLEDAGKEVQNEK